MNRAAQTRASLCALFCTCVAGLAFTLEARAAGGAYIVDDAVIGAPGACQVESWLALASTHDLAAVTAPACVVNFGHPVEITTQFSRTSSNGIWDTAFTLKGKTTLLPVEGNSFGLGLIGTMSYDITGHQISTATVFVPLTIQLSEPLKLNLNAGLFRDQANNRSFGLWGAGVEYSINKPITLIAEVFGGQGTSKPAVQGGIRYTPVDKVDFDLIYGRNLTGEEANWLTLGVNLRF
jgi:hypothetical protein